MKNSIELTKEQRSQLEEVISKGITKARKIMHAQVLLKIDSGKAGPNWSDGQIKEAFGVSPSTISRMRQRFLEHGLNDALNRRPQPERPEKRKLTGDQEAQLVALACTEAPIGYSRWTIRLLTKTAIELEIVEEIGRETIRLVLKENELKPWLNKRFCIPPEANEEFVHNMEDVLDVYHRPYDPRFPQICMDEGSKQLLGEKREPIPMEPGKPKREDYEYEREGVYDIFGACEPLTGKYFFEVTSSRTKKDWAYFMRDLIDNHYKDAEKLILVMDNLNTHGPGSFYKVFEAAEARRLTQKLEIHYTPTHGSWLNIAEIALSILARQCLSERIKTIEKVKEKVTAWQDKRNQAHITVNWRFTNAEARIKLKRLYPVMAA
jgi:transposase/predicted DNA-binding protein